MPATQPKAASLPRLTISDGSLGAESVRTDGSRLTLRATLHYLWEQAQLNRWTPGMAGKRSWYVVRKHLLQAAADKATVGHPLSELLFIPEQFSVDQKTKSWRGGSPSIPGSRVRPVRRAS